MVDVFAKKLNCEYRLQNLPKDALERQRETLESMLSRLENAVDSPTDISVYLKSPV